MRISLKFALATLALAGATAFAQESIPVPRTIPDAKTIMDTLVRNEQAATDHRGRYMYLSVEKSERTNGHTWTERMAETPWGKVKFLIAEDGKPLTGDRLSAEKARLAQEAADPEGFKRQEEARSDDEQHARQMVRLLPRAFLFDAPTPDGDTLRVAFHPNPGYSPQGIEERVLHGMSGTVLIDAKTIRLRGLDARVPQDISIGFGILGVVKAGSNFSTMRVPAEGIDWKTQTVHTDLNGKVLMLKTLNRQQDSNHSDFKKIPNDITVAAAVKLLEQ